MNLGGFNERIEQSDSVCRFLKFLEHLQLSQRVKLDTVPIIEPVLFTDLDCNVGALFFTFGQRELVILRENLLQILQVSDGLLVRF